MNIVDLTTLTKRQKQVFKLLVSGLNHREIAKELNVTQKAINWHLTNIYKKLNVKTKYQLLGQLCTKKVTVYKKVDKFYGNTQ